MSEFNGPHDVYGQGFPQAKPEPKSLWAKALEGNQPVPRVASSLDDLRVGQVVIVHKENYSEDEPTLVAKGTVFQPSGNQLLGIEYESPLRGWDSIYQSDVVVILADTHPHEPVTVSRAAIDRLARIVGRDEPMKADAQTAMVDAIWHDEFVDAARALLAEVRAQEPTP